MYKRQRYLPLKRSLPFLALGLSLFSAVSGRADQLSVLGSADTFAVLAGSTITNTGATTLSGNVGLYPGTSATGFDTVTLTSGTVYLANGVAMTAQSDALTGFNHLAGLPSTQNLSGQDLGGQTLFPGVYAYSSSAQLTGALTVNFAGANNADVVIQVNSALTTASASSVNVINQGTGDNLYFEVGSSATLGTATMFQGDLLAYTSITLDNGASISCGSALALNGAVTMDTNVINNCSSTGSDITPLGTGGSAGSGGGGNPSPVPEPASFALLATGLLGAAGAARRRSVA